MKTRNHENRITDRHRILTCLPINSYKKVVLTYKEMLLLLLVPVLISCNKDISKIEDVPGADTRQERQSSYIKCKSPFSTKTLDIFFFNDDRLRKLDCHHRITNPRQSRIATASRYGKKIICAIANSKISEEEIFDIDSYSDLEDIVCDLSQEQPDCPTMAGEYHMDAGSDMECVLTLEPLLSEIIINSISCDFHKKPYANAVLEDVSVYLTNVCSRSPLIDKTPEIPAGILNYGKMTPSDTVGFSRHDMFCTRIPDAIGSSVVYPDIHLYCYPNISENEGLGSPFTRLVIEGTLDGKKTYYPININRDGPYLENISGVRRNKSYIYDITLTRRGVPDPDTPIRLDDLRISFEVIDWTERSHRTIIY